MRPAQRRSSTERTSRSFRSAVGKTEQNRYEQARDSFHSGDTGWRWGVGAGAGPDATRRHDGRARRTVSGPGSGSARAADGTNHEDAEGRIQRRDPYRQHRGQYHHHSRRRKRSDTGSDQDVRGRTTDEAREMLGLVQVDITERGGRARSGRATRKGMITATSAAAMSTYRSPSTWPPQPARACRPPRCPVTFPARTSPATSRSSR